MPMGIFKNFGSRIWPILGATFFGKSFGSKIGKIPGSCNENIRFYRASARKKNQGCFLALVFWLKIPQNQGYEMTDYDSGCSSYDYEWQAPGPEKPLQHQNLPQNPKTII